MLNQTDNAARRPTQIKRGPTAIALASAILFAGLLPPLHAHISSQADAEKKQLSAHAGKASVGKVAERTGTLRQRLNDTAKATPIAAAVLYFGLVPANAADQAAAAPEAALPPQAGKDASEPKPDSADEARAFAESWARAWSERDVDAYLAAYGKGFSPEKGISRSAWEQLRRQKIESRKTISVSFRELKIDVVDHERVEVRFLQDYAADNFRESGTPKLLVLAHENGAWRIVGESTESAQVARK